MEQEGNKYLLIKNYINVNKINDMHTVLDGAKIIFSPEEKDALYEKDLSLYDGFIFEERDETKFDNDSSDYFILGEYEIKDGKLTMLNDYSDFHTYEMSISEKQQIKANMTVPMMIAYHVDAMRCHDVKEKMLKFKVRFLDYFQSEIKRYFHNAIYPDVNGNFKVETRFLPPGLDIAKEIERFAQIFTGFSEGEVRMNYNDREWFYVCYDGEKITYKKHNHFISEDKYFDSAKEIIEVISNGKAGNCN